MRTCEVRCADIATDMVIAAYIVDAVAIENQVPAIGATISQTVQ
jgi:hypothetical protein